MTGGDGMTGGGGMTGVLSLCSSTDCSYCSCDIIVLSVAIVPSHCNKKQKVIKRAHAKILPRDRV